MTRTEQIIEKYRDTWCGGSPAASEVLEELHRLSRLCDAYWAEIEAWRALDDAAYERAIASRLGMDPGSAKMDAIMADSKKLKAATDAARREAGEGQ